MDDEEKEGEIEYYKCPFCKDDDYDLIGLKIHLLNFCEEFNEVNITTRQY